MSEGKHVNLCHYEKDISPEKSTTADRGAHMVGLTTLLSVPECFRSDKYVKRI